MLVYSEIPMGEMGRTVNITGFGGNRTARIEKDPYRKMGRTINVTGF